MAHDEIDFFFTRNSIDFFHSESNKVTLPRLLKHSLQEFLDYSEEKHMRMGESQSHYCYHDIEAVNYFYSFSLS